MDVKEKIFGYLDKYMVIQDEKSIKVIYDFKNIQQAVMFNKITGELASDILFRNYFKNYFSVNIHQIIREWIPYKPKVIPCVSEFIKPGAILAGNPLGCARDFYCIVEVHKKTIDVIKMGHTNGDYAHYPYNHINPHPIKIFRKKLIKSNEDNGYFNNTIHVGRGTGSYICRLWDGKESNIKNIGSEVLHLTLKEFYP